MARTKQKRLTKVKELPNVFFQENFNLKEILKNFSRSKSLITVEIGCGHGDYSIELAQIFPQRKFIGVDVKGARIFNGALKAIDKNLSDVAFLIGGGAPARESLPVESVHEIASRILSREQRGVQALQYGSPIGIPELLQAVIDHLLAPKGIQAGLENV